MPWFWHTIFAKFVPSLRDLAFSICAMAQTQSPSSTDTEVRWCLLSALPLMAQRWTADRVARWEVRKGAWDLSRPDLLPAFLERLPPPLRQTQEIKVNKHGNEATLTTLVYRDGEPGAPMYWHGTTYLAVENILRHGFRDSSDPAVHEFTMPGLYVADHLDCSLYYHATATKFAPAPHDHRLPYVRFVFRVAVCGKPKKVSSYGVGKQLVFDACNVIPLELHVYRGWHFIDGGERVLSITSDEADAFAAKDCTPATAPPPIQVPAGKVEHRVQDEEPPEPFLRAHIPPPPPVNWRVVPAGASGNAVPYYWNTVTGVVQWHKPDEPFLRVHIPPPPPVIWRVVLAGTRGNAVPYYWNTVTDVVQWSEPDEPYHTLLDHRAWLGRKSMQRTHGWVSAEVSA